MIIKLIIFSFLAVTFYSFYHRKLNQKLKPSFVKPVTVALTLVSLAPMGLDFRLNWTLFNSKTICEKTRWNKQHMRKMWHISKRK